MRFSFKNTFKGLNLEKMKGEEGDILPRIQAMVEEEEGTTMMVGEGAIKSHKGNLHISKFQKFKGKNDPNIYIEWEQKVHKIFNIHLASDQEHVDLVVLEFEDYTMTWWHQLCMHNIN